MIAWLCVAAVHLRTTQGTYEDHAQISPYASLTAPAPPFWRARGLTQTTLWIQARAGDAPRAFRLVNLVLGAVVALSVGLLASRLGLSAWIAAGVMALHPLATEALASLSGRGELIATLGLVWACLAALGARGPLQAAALASACLGVGYLGKETALIGVALVPLALALRADASRWAGRLALVGLAAVVAAAWWMRNQGLSVSTLGADRAVWTIRQAAAAFRLIAALVVPLGQTVDPDLDAWASIWLGVALVGLLTAAWLTVELWISRARVLAWGGACILLVSLPRLIVMTPRSYLNEHQMYPALVGFALIVAALVRAAEASCEII